MAAFIRVQAVDEDYDETLNIAHIARVSKSDADGEGCTIQLMDGEFIYCSESKRTIDARLDIATREVTK